MAKEIKYKGKNIEEVKNMSINEFITLVTSRSKRSLKRGLTEQQKKLLKNIEETKKNPRKIIKTHCRDMVIIPLMIGVKLLVHNGKTFTLVNITEEMLGHRLGEFSYTRTKVKHSAPGIGATKSSAAVSVK